MDVSSFSIRLYLPAQGATEVDATLVEWRVADGQTFKKGAVLAVVDSAKSVFDFEAPCEGRVVRLLVAAGDAVAYTSPVMEIETSDSAMRDWIPPAVATPAAATIAPAAAAARQVAAPFRTAVIRGIGGYVPRRVVTNKELLVDFPDLTDDYIYQVTGIRERRWADDNEKPSDMAYAAALEAIRKANLGIRDIDAVIVATTTPDVVMPALACFLQDRLGLGRVPAFDLNAACSGWLYVLAVAQGLIAIGQAKNILTVGVDMQSRLLEQKDRATRFIFGDGAGAAVVSGVEEGHAIRSVLLSCDSSGITIAGRYQPGHRIGGQADTDPWIRLNGQVLFRFAVESFSAITRDVIAQAGWKPDEVRWIIPHQANGRILAAAAKKARVPFDRFYLNMERLGNTSSASIPLALIEVENDLKKGDKLVLCSVGAGATMAAVALEW